MYEVEGKPRNFSIKLLDEVMAFAWKKLRIGPTVYVTVEFSKNFPEQTAGYAYGDASCKEATIEINKNLDLNTMVSTILHEMVHVKQIMSKKLVQGEGNKPSKWLGVETKGKYADLPWEIEAYKLEEVMLAEFKNGEFIAE